MDAHDLGNWAVGDDDAEVGLTGTGEFSIDSGVGTDNAKVYIRAWDAGTISAASYHYEIQ